MLRLLKVRSFENREIMTVISGVRMPATSWLTTSFVALPMITPRASARMLFWPRKSRKPFICVWAEPVSLLPTALASNSLIIFIRSMLILFSFFRDFFMIVF